MSEQNIDVEAAKLAVRFKGVNQAEFARTHGVPGGKSMISQHINGRRPIGIEAAISYAKGFDCSIAEISPRVSQTLSSALPFLREPVESSFDDWRLKASPRSVAVIDMLKIAARRNALTEADWELIEQLAARFAK